MLKQSVTYNMQSSLSGHATIMGGRHLLWGCIAILVGLAEGLSAYYLNMMFLRYMAFSFIVLGSISLFMAMQFDFKNEFKSSLLPWLLVLGLSTLYFVLRMQLHRFDFGVGDASDYYVAGVCSVTYGQDIGFFLPLTASVSALGYSVFGSAYAPWIDVILYSATIPVGYFLVRILGLNPWLSFFITLFMVINPLSIWFSKSSFSEPIWQLLLLIFMLVAYRISSKASIRFLELVVLYIILALVPFLRGEGVLYYGPVLFLALYHFWQFSNLKASLIIVFGLFVVAASIHVTLGIREHYLLGWQFSRIIPHITAYQLLGLLYGLAGVSALLLLLIHLGKKVFSSFPFPLIVTLCALLFKGIVAYIYAEKKPPSFLDFLFVHEYELVLGNFGMPLAWLIGMGLIFLFYKALKGEKLPLMLVVVYTVFYLPFVMQGVTFYDPHELFLYWNRYYFSVFMMIHIFALALSMQFLYEQVQRVILEKKYVVLFMGIFMLVISLSSLNLKVEKMVIEEAYLENSDKVFTWLKKYVERSSISVVYDTSIRYERHNGVYDAKVFVSRMFSVVQINVKKWQKVNTKKFTSHMRLDKDIFKNRYLVTFSAKKEMLQNKSLKLLSQRVFDISWREHYRAQPRTPDECSGDVSKSYKNELPLHVFIYKIIK